jgi:hypothetical protein
MPVSNRVDRTGSLAAMAHSPPKTKTGSIKRQIDRLDPRERRFSYIAAGAAVVFGLAVYLVQTNNPKFRLAKGQLTPQTSLILGIGCGALLVVATRVDRRAAVGFVALLTFLAFGTTDFALGVPFLVLAGWLLYRSYKLQKEASATLRQASAAAAKDSATLSRGTASKSASAKGRASDPGRAGANKRYTPKRPPLPAPKPSRRERKAAEASD